MWVRGTNGKLVNSQAVQQFRVVGGEPTAPNPTTGITPKAPHRLVAIFAGGMSASGATIAKGTEAQVQVALLQLSVLLDAKDTTKDEKGQAN